MRRASASSLRPPGTMISGQGRVPATDPAKWLISGPGPPSVAAAEHQRGNVVALLEELGHDLHRIALPDDDRRLDPGFLHDRAGGLDEHRFGAQPRFLLHRRLDAAPLDEFLGCGISARISTPPPVRAARRAAKRSAASASSVSSITTRYERIHLAPDLSPTPAPDPAPSRQARARSRSRGTAPSTSAQDRP